jgi:hypothetical protein
MKKSELIEILALAYANLPPNSSPKVVAKEMLRVAEKHGMMPVREMECGCCYNFEFEEE